MLALRGTVVLFFIGGAAAVMRSAFGCPFGGGVFARTLLLLAALSIVVTIAVQGGVVRRERISALVPRKTDVLRSIAIRKFAHTLAVSVSLVRLLLLPSPCFRKLASSASNVASPEHGSIVFCSEWIPWRSAVRSIPDTAGAMGPRVPWYDRTFLPVHFRGSRRLLFFPCSGCG